MDTKVQKKVFYNKFSPSSVSYSADNNITCNDRTPIAVAARSKARTVFARSNTEIVSSNPTEAWMFVCVMCAFILCLHSLK
jgi:hypothetical protein